MQIKKETQILSAGAPTQAQLAAIRAQAKGEVTAQQVYVFALRLCDDQIDRDMERFDTAALPELAKMFIGKTGIIDHRWSTDAQIARVFETQVVREENVSYIKAWAYIRRGGQADEVIADIEAGIKKEVSVGCAMGRSICSVCGAEYGTCGHEKGNYYDGLLCCAILQEPMDAYEFSFVAVPAQREAGVLKAMGGATGNLKELAEKCGAQKEYRELHRMAQLGQEYARQLCDDVVRLCLQLELGVEEPVLRAVAEKAAAEDLGKMKTALQARVAQRTPGFSQLCAAFPKEKPMESGFLI